MRKYLHPENLFGIGLNKYQRVINYLSLPDQGESSKQLVENVTSILKPRELRSLRGIIKRDKIGDIDESLNAGYAMKFFQDVIDKYPSKRLPVFVVGKDFFSIAKNIQRDVPIKHINTFGDFYYLAFAHNKYCGAYVTSEFDDDLWEKENGEEVDSFMLRICLVTKEYDLTASGVLSFLINEDVLSIEDMVTAKSVDCISRVKDNALITAIENAGDLTPLMFGILNTLIYINSKDPEIESFRPLREYSKKELGSVKYDKKPNLCTMPIKFVNWGFNGKKYTKDSSSVKPHMRWQPCGPGRSEVKLVWVKEHVRRYNV